MYGAINKQETGDFNADIKPDIKPHFFCSTRSAKSLDPFYFTHRSAYKALPRPLFGKSILLLPIYKQTLKQEVTLMPSVRQESNKADARL
jgi:hypothetical protein